MRTQPYEPPLSPAERHMGEVQCRLEKLYVKSTQADVTAEDIVADTEAFLAWMRRVVK